ncbi:MAG: DUF2974 domain-containing protein [Ruminococcaceae bacterium]|nr:DUF2974 domain-containing protein [Oscillospiraceae bacterium]
MADVFDYLEWRGDISFSEVGVNEIDSLILSMICYVDFDGIVPRGRKNSPTLLAAARQYTNEHKGENIKMGAILPSGIINLLVRAAKTRRFGGARLSGYVNKVELESQTQFSALTYSLGDKTTFVAYRGTDDTLVGWKEDFNMSFMSAVPAQLEAVSYLEEAAEAFEGDIYCGGHSKGGNLAIYATVKARAEVGDRVLRTYNLDGPGFTREFIESEEYARAREKLVTIIPESSVVGMLLEHEENYEVVKSKQMGLLQHYAPFWELMGSRFLRLNDVSEDSKIIDRTLKSWLSQMDMKQREEFVDTLYDILISTNATTLSDIADDKMKLIKAWGSVPDEHKALVLKSIKLLVRNVKLKVR